MFSIKELDEFWAYKALLLDVTKKLSYCVKAELVPLMEVAGVLEVSKNIYIQLSLKKNHNLSGAVKIISTLKVPETVGDLPFP